MLVLILSLRVENTEKKTWDEAQTNCKTKANADLASITSKSVEDKLIELAGTTTGLMMIWIGADDKDNPDKEFKWVISGTVFWKDGAAVEGEYNNWFKTAGTSQPSHGNKQVYIIGVGD